jgi:hypothetical protein
LAGRGQSARVRTWPKPPAHEGNGEIERAAPLNSVGWPEQCRLPDPIGICAISGRSGRDKHNDHHRAAQLGSRLGQAIRTLDQPAAMSGVRIKLRYGERERE